MRRWGKTVLFAGVSLAVAGCPKAQAIAGDQRGRGSPRRIPHRGNAGNRHRATGHIQDKGQAIISATRQPNTPGVNGSGTLLGIVVKALTPGSSNQSVVRVNAKDPQLKPISLVSSEAKVQVQP